MKIDPANLRTIRNYARTNSIRADHVRHFVQLGKLTSVVVDGMHFIDIKKHPKPPDVPDAPLNGQPINDTFEQIYEVLLPRLNVLGEITTAEVAKLSPHPYTITSIAFRHIMKTMTEQGKAKMMCNGRYEILKPNKK